MFVQHRGRDLELVVRRPVVTEADLTRVLGLPDPPGPRRLDEVGLHAGAELLAEPRAEGSPEPLGEAGAAVVAVVGGIDAGSWRAVPPGAVVRVGRARPAADPEARRSDLAVDDPTVSRRHAVLTRRSDGWTVLDAGSRNGTWRRDAGEERPVASGPAGALGPGGPAGEVVEDATELRLGASTVALRVLPADGPTGGPRRPGPDGTAPFNRPPRPALPPLPPAVPVPSPPVPPTRAPALGVVAILGPLVMAAVMVAMLGNPAFALLALLSPVLAVGGHLEARRRERRGGRRDAAQWAAAVDGFADSVATAAALEEARRRAVAPDPAEVRRRARGPATSLWQRRPASEDWLRFRVGTADQPWSPTLAAEGAGAGGHGPLHPDLASALAATGCLLAAPVIVDLSAGGVVGVVGELWSTRAVARCLLVQAAVHHGPADLAVVVACTPERVGDWDWAKWLPHVHDPAGGGRLLAAGRDEADAVAGAISGAIAGAAQGTSGARAHLVVVDDATLLTGRRAPLRALLGLDAISGIVLARTADELPACCRVVVAVRDDGAAEVSEPAAAAACAGVRLDGLAAVTARDVALALARFEDPELAEAGAGLPAGIRLADLLGLAGPDEARSWAAAVAARWTAAGVDPRLSVPLGVDAHGAVEIDLAADGPHALVAGTTGSGKSELLRSLVAGLAVGSSPEHLTFVLIDFKGGSAFDACARLPHTVGLVTDLDEGLAERARRCLEAELRHRERILRAAGAGDLASFRALRADGLPRLVVVVDEFATLRAELPGFVDALLGIAQRGRSLGVHLVLATQRPAGSVSDQVRANTNLRIALRVQDPADSTDVVGVPDASRLPRSRPGRACVRLGPGEVLTMQAAQVSCPPGDGGPPLALRPFAFGPGLPEPAAFARPDEEAGPTDLDRLVDACAAAWAALGGAAPRRPWPEPLPGELALDGLLAVGAEGDGPPGGTIAVGLADDPDRQCRFVTGWRPAAGNLVVAGGRRSGRTTTLLATLRAAAAALAPDGLQVFVVDHGGGEGGLAPVASLPHVAAVLGATEGERQRRLLRHLGAELDRRRALPPEAVAREPLVVLAVDGIGGFLADHDDLAGLAVAEAFTRVFAGGPAVGIVTAVVAERPGALPAALLSLVRQRWVHRLDDPGDAVLAGPSPVGLGGWSTLPPGRFVDATSGLPVQVATPDDGWTSACHEVADRWAGQPRVPVPPLGALPAQVTTADLPTGVAVAGAPWVLPVGIADDDLAPAWLRVHPGDHVLIAGPGRSGRTAGLATVAAALLAARPDATVIALSGRRSWLGDVPGARVAGSSTEAAALALAAADGGSVPVAVLIDDAEAVEDADGALAALLAADPPGVAVVAAGRADVLRGLYGHWTRTLRRSRLGVLLCPDVDLDGELLGAVLPRRSPAPWLPGRGYLVVDGTPALVQLVTPTR